MPSLARNILPSSSLLTPITPIPPRSARWPPPIVSQAAIAGHCLSEHASPRTLLALLCSSRAAGCPIEPKPDPAARPNLTHGHATEALQDCLRPLVHSIPSLSCSSFAPLPPGHVHLGATFVLAAHGTFWAAGAARARLDGRVNLQLQSYPPPHPIPFALLLTLTPSSPSCPPHQECEPLAALAAPGSSGGCQRVWPRPDCRSWRATRQHLSRHGGERRGSPTMAAGRMQWNLRRRVDHNPSRKDSCGSRACSNARRLVSHRSWQHLAEYPVLPCQNSFTATLWRAPIPPETTTCCEFSFIFVGSLRAE